MKNVKATEIAEEKSFAPRVRLLPPLCVVSGGEDGVREKKCVGDDGKGKGKK